MQIDLDGTDRRLLYLEVLALIATAVGALSAFLSWTDLRLSDGLDFGTPSAVDFIHHYLSMNGYAFFFPAAACAVLGVSLIPMIARRRMSTYATAVSAVVLLMDLVADVLGYCFLSWNTGWLAYTVETWDRMMVGAYLFTVSAILCTVLNAAVLARCWRVKGHHGFNRRMWVAAIIVIIIGIAVAYGWYLYTLDDAKGPHIDDEYEISSLVLVSDGSELPGSSGIVVRDVSDLDAIRSASVMLRDPDGRLSSVTGYAVSDGLPDALEPGGVYGYTVSYGGLSSTVYAVAAADDLAVDSDVTYTATSGPGGTRYTFDMLSDGRIALSGRLVGGITVETRGHALDLSIDGLEIVGCSGAPLEIVKAGTVTMTVAGDCSIVDYAPKAWKLESYAVHCGGDLSISGDGSLSVYSGNLGGLRGLGSVTVDGSSLSVDSMKTSIRAKGEVSVVSGAVDTVSRHGDGIHGRTFSAGSDSPASVTVMAADDGIQGKRGVTMQGDSLTVTVLTDRYSQHTLGAPCLLEPDHYDRNNTKGHSCKGIKSDGDMTISGGTYVVSSRDDAFHTNGRLTISGGAFDICSGDDGMHADGNITISGAVIRMQSYEGIEGDLITLNSGDYTIRTEDDGINASYGDHGGVVVNGGRFYIVSEGDGFDSNLERRARGVTFNGGELFIWSTAGQAGVDTEQGYTFNGGHVVMVCVPGVASMQSTYCSDAEQFSYGCAVPGPGFMTVTGGGASMTVATTEDRSSLLVALGFGDSAVFSFSGTDPGGLDANGVRWDLRYHDGPGGASASP